MSVISGNLKAGLPGLEQGDPEWFDGLVQTPNARIERILSHGQVTPQGQWYDQAEDEFVVLIQGAAQLQIEGESQPRQLMAGDWLLLPAHCRHRVVWTDPNQPSLWLALHLRT
ncbi:cupin domain-containing protein [Ferrimonas balearica]|uniref:cupin domain-containing protein n=1 Tax=Ferrimonas balearica TaxID=44012 RepID=UPI001C97F3F3|nr:cupin domain-containing protein [Ferrimonas balearica]MBY5982272.1 cupin domain-containing protein [Ferrimonas balearica]